MTTQAETLSMLDDEVSSEYLKIFRKRLLNLELKALQAYVPQLLDEMLASDDWLSLQYAVEHYFGPSMMREMARAGTLFAQLNSRMDVLLTKRPYYVFEMCFNDELKRRDIHLQLIISNEHDSLYGCHLQRV